ncbi:MAG: Lcl C-terminal domain-containing protein [Planctomycetota bacterium]
MAMYDCVHDPFVCCDLGVDTGTETETASETETETETETVTETASDTDTVTETETETETETVSDTDTGTDTGTGTEPQCPGWLDVVAGLCWEDQPAASPMTYEWGGERCEDVSAEYGGEWRLPLIQELRSLIQGCVTVDCGVTDPSCLSNSCLSGPLCIPCSFMDGPGPDGCYWDPELDGPCEWYWSASPGNNPAYGWGVKFQYAEIAGKLRSQELYVRCVRNWP